MPPTSGKDLSGLVTAQVPRRGRRRNLTLQPQTWEEMGGHVYFESNKHCISHFYSSVPDMKQILSLFEMFVLGIISQIFPLWIMLNKSYEEEKIFCVTLPLSQGPRDGTGHVLSTSKGHIWGAFIIQRKCLLDWSKLKLTTRGDWLMLNFIRKLFSLQPDCCLMKVSIKVVIIIFESHCSLPINEDDFASHERPS